MTNSEITNVILGDTEASALYMGDRLVWQRGGYGKNALVGEFTDNSTAADWWYKEGEDDSNCDKVSLSAQYFNQDVEITNSWFGFDSNVQLQNIYHLPKVKLSLMDYMFYNCRSLLSVNLNNLDTSNATSMRGLFHNCYNLTDIELSRLDTSQVTDMIEVFNNCYNLKEVSLSGLNTSKVTNMSGIFNYCDKLKKVDLSHLDLSNVTNMNQAFYRCEAIKEIDLSSSDMSNLTYTMSMFDFCRELTTLAFNNFRIDREIGFNDCNELTTIRGTVICNCPLNLSYSPLTNESAMVIINGLLPTTRAYSIIFSQPTFDTLTDEQISIATSKGWNVVRASFPIT